MSRPRRARWALLLAAAGLAAAGLAVLPPEPRTMLARGAVVLAGLVIATIYLRRTGRVTAATPELFELALRQPTAAPQVIPSLRAVEMTVRLSTANAQDFDVRLRPMLRELARWRLMTNRGVDIDRAPDEARRILDEPLRTLIHGPDAPSAFGSPGVRLADLNAGLDQLERI